MRAGYLDGLILFGFALSVFAYFALTPVIRYERALLRAARRARLPSPSEHGRSGGTLRQRRGQRGDRPGALRVAGQRPVVRVRRGCSAWALPTRAATSDPSATMSRLTAIAAKPM